VVGAVNVDLVVVAPTLPAPGETVVGVPARRIRSRRTAEDELESGESRGESKG